MSESDPMADPNPESAMEEGIKEYFNNHPKWSFERFLGSGVYGYAVLAKQRTNDPPARCVVKRGQLEEDWEAHRNEIEMLRRVRGAAHIVELLAYNNGGDTDSGDARNVLRRAARWVRRQRRGGRIPGLLGLRRRPDYASIGSDLPGPTLILQYAPNGTLERLRKAGWITGRSIPNRVLWSLFLCLVRFAVGLAYPPSGVPKGEKRLEVIREGKDPRYIKHTDLHEGNIVFQDMSSFPGEHPTTPSLLVIDFGLASEAPNDPWAIVENIKAIGSVMLRINNAWLDNEDWNPDPDLVDLIDSCIGENELYNPMPKLPELLETLERAVRERDAAWYENSGLIGWEIETDEEVHDFVQTMILEPATASDPPVIQPEVDGAEMVDVAFDANVGQPADPSS